MSKKAKKSTPYSTPNLQEKPVDYSSSIITIIISLYLLIECVPQVQIHDQMGLHWLLLSILNGFSLLYLFKNQTIINVGQFTQFLKSGIVILYLLFFVFAGFSLLAALNVIEGLVVYNRLFTSVLAFLILCILLLNKIHLLKNIALIITLITLLQAFGAVTQFYKGLNNIQIDTLINSLQGTTGNKNIFAAAFIIKLPFIIYSIFIRKGFLQYLAILALSLSFFAIFLINARAAFISLILEIVIVLTATAYVHWKENQFKKYLLKGSFIIGALLITFFISQNSLKIATKNTSSAFGTVGSRLGTLAEQSTAESNIRLAYWKKSIELIKKKPFKGVGYGNWKLYTPLYTNTLLDDNVFSKHPHNDFIEIAGETGIPNALIYLSIFIVALFVTIKTLIENRSLEEKTITIIAFAAMCGYFVDAFFNFPAERPNIQVLFALAMAILLVNWLSGKEITANKSGTKLIRLFCLVTLLLSVGSIYVHAMVFKSLQAQYKVDNDLAAIDNIPNAMPNYKFEEVNKMLPNFPNIGESSETMGYKKAKYLQKEKRYDEAIKLLDSVHHQMPNLPYNDYLKSNIYLEEKKLDSAYKYAKKAAYAKPRHFYYFRMASYLAREHKDVKEIQKLFDQYNKYRKDQQSYSYYAQSMFYSDYSKTEVKKIVEKGLTLYPTDETMLGLKPYLP